MLSTKEVQHIASLARIELSDSEVLKFQKELGSILGYFDILSEIDTSAIEPMTHAVFVQNVKRSDSAKPDQEASRLLKMAPATKGKHLKVKSIL